MSAKTTARRVTSTDVAARAGLSRSTVSQILNGDDRFPVETRERVRTAAAELGYRPSRAGRALVTGLSDIVVIVVPNATFGPHLQDSVDRITSASALSGMSVVVRFGTADGSTLTSVLDLRPAAVVDLGILDSAQRDQIEALGTRIIPSLGRQNDSPDRDPFDIFIGRLQTQELLRHGPRRIIYAGLDDGRLDPFGPPRLEGASRECAERGLEAPRTIRVPLRVEDAVQALSDVIDRGAGPIGICAYNDDVAIAILAATRRLGLSVPSEVAIVGVDHTAIGQLITPRLTTVHINLAAIMDDLAGELTQLRSRSDPLAVSLPAVDASSRVRLVPGETA